MKLFETKEIRAARDYALHGGQALHMMSGQWAKGWGGPSCFRHAREFAHLLDQDIERLKQTARTLGVRVIKVSRAGTPNQHIDLCGKPLERAKEQIEIDPSLMNPSWSDRPCDLQKIREFK